MNAARIPDSAADQLDHDVDLIEALVAHGGLDAVVAVDATQLFHQILWNLDVEAVAGSGGIAAEKAGVAKGTLYRYFESKADLYVAVLADNGNAFTERMKEVSTESATPTWR